MAGGQKGFTLVELAVVVVIIGVIVSAVLVGKDLINSSRLRTISSDVIEFETAISLFTDHYSGLPGDTTQATAYWPGLTGNGNGNGLLDTTTEFSRGWQHMGLANLIRGDYSGACCVLQPGTNAPASKFNGGSYQFYYGTTPATYGRTYIQGILVGAPIAAFFYPNAPLLTPREAWAVDNKMDDGGASTGRLLGLDALVGMYLTARKAPITRIGPVLPVPQPIKQRIVHRNAGCCMC